LEMRRKRQRHKMADEAVVEQPQTEEPVVEEVPKVEAPATEETQTDETEETPEEEEESSTEEEEETPTETEEPLPDEATFGLDLKKFREEFPDALKKYPTLRSALYHGKAMLEAFPSVEEAKQAKDKLADVEEFERSLVSGDPKPLLSRLFNFNPEVGRQFVEDFLPSIEKGSKELYVQITWPVLHKVLRGAMKDGNDGSDYGKNLQAAAIVLHKYLTGSTEIAEKLPEKQGPSKELQQIQQQSMALVQRQVEDFQEDVYEAGERAVESRLDKMIDGKVPENLRKITKQAIMEELDDRLKTDTIHMSKIQSLWNEVRRSGLNRGMKPKIVNAYLGQALKILPSISQKHLSALAGAKGVEKSPERKRIPQSTPLSGTKRPDPSKIDWSRTTSQDYLMGKIAYKK
jgi:hypothetical protein